MTTQLINIILNNLPRYAEEEGDFYSVSREDLMNVLHLENQIDIITAKTIIEFIETLLNTLAVLNTDYLKNGEWCFVSFSAQLMAMSVLTAMANNSRFFETNFWNTQNICHAKKEEQLNILKEIENRRVNYSANAQPIRYIYVAWSIIKLDDKILLFQREDIKKRHDNKAGDYGLVGGRLNQRDIINFDKNQKLYLSQLQSNNALFIKETISETLKRELSEETKLSFETHYDFKLWRELKPFRQVQGTAPHHAFTEYYFYLFTIKLNLEGYLVLQHELKTNERLVLFSIDDIKNGKTVDNKLAYLNALVNDFDNNRETLANELANLTNSFQADYLFTKNNYSITLQSDETLVVGTLGKEKILNIDLTLRQQQLLLALAVHNRGFEFEHLLHDIALYPFGWVKITNESLQKEFEQLAHLLCTTDFKIENQRDSFFRFSVEPSLLYFDNDLFSFSLIKDKITIQRDTIKTALGNIASYTETFKLSPRLFNNIQNKDSLDNYKKSDLSKSIQKMGLKCLLCEKHKEIQLCIRPQII